MTRSIWSGKRAMQGVRNLGLISFASTMLFSGAVHAGIVAGSVGQIVHLYTYSTFGNGDVAVVVQTPLSGCVDGFWLRSSDPGFKTVFAQLMTARATKTPIRVWAYNDQIWSGSTGQFCRIDALDLDS